MGMALTKVELDENGKPKLLASERFMNVMRDYFLSQAAKQEERLARAARRAARRQIGVGQVDSESTDSLDDVTQTSLDSPDG